jgi:uncharacterized membrane protein YbhN (UPF0104 family)
LLPRIHFRGRDLLKLFRWSGLIMFPIILVMGINLSKTAHVLRDSNLVLVLAGLALMQVAIFLRVWRWKLVAEASGVHYPRFWDYLSLFYTGLFAGTAMPQIAASFAPVLFVSDHGKSWRRAVISILFDRFVELAIILLFAFAAAIYLYRDFPKMSIAVIAGLIVVAIGAALAFPVFRFLRGRVGDAASVRWPMVNTLFQAMDADDTKDIVAKLRGCLASVAGLSAVILVIQTGIIVALAEALSLNVPLPFLIMSWSLVTLAVTLPISIGGLGLREGVLVAMFVAVGEPKEDALALGLLFFVVVMITRLPGGVPWFRNTAASSARKASNALSGDQAVQADANAIQ